MAMANPALNHYDLYNTSDENENTILHYAAASPTDSVDIVHFLLQQLQLYFQQVVELQMAHNDILNARNAFYETPLIRAAHEGNLRVVHNLCMMPDIDILAADSLGNTAAHHAAVMGHIDSLHYLLECEKLAKNKGLKLMLEEPTKPLGGVDEYGRDVLHHAVENEQIVVAQYVLSRGDFDIMRADESNLTPRKKAESAPLMRELDLDTKSPLKSLRCRSTRWSNLLAWSIPLSLVLCLSCWLPWYLEVPLVAASTLIYFRALQKRLRRHSHIGTDLLRSSLLHAARRRISFTPHVQICRRMSRNETTQEHESRFCQFSLPKLRSAIANPPSEIGLAIWLAWLVTFNFYIVIIMSKTTYRKSLSSTFVWILWCSIIAIEVPFIWLWIKLTFASTIGSNDIETIEKDLSHVLDKFAKHGVPIVSGEPRLCTTCYVKRPLRSKHCASCGVCVARMDHHCIWINRCVGYGNHRLFMIFVLLHALLIAAFASLSLIILNEQLYTSAFQKAFANDKRFAERYIKHLWNSFPIVIGNDLLPLLVSVWSLLVGSGLIYLFSQQIKNISRNLTVNESINWRRYHYLQKGTTVSSLCPSVLDFHNVFDRGALRNWIEFLLQEVDYRSVFDFPEDKISDPGQGSSAAFASGTHDIGHSMGPTVVV